MRLRNTRAGMSIDEFMARWSREYDLPQLPRAADFPEGSPLRALWERTATAGHQTGTVESAEIDQPWPPLEGMAPQGCVFTVTAKGDPLAPSPSASDPALGRPRLWQRLLRWRSQVPTR